MVFRFISYIPWVCFVISFVPNERRRSGWVEIFVRSSTRAPGALRNVPQCGCLLSFPSIGLWFTFFIILRFATESRCRLSESCCGTVFLFLTSLKLVASLPFLACRVESFYG